MHSKKRTKTPVPMKNVYGNNILVTGATSGIGRACAIAFAKAGCAVTGLAIDAEEKETSFAGGGRIRYVQADVTDDLSVANAMNSVGDSDWRALRKKCPLILPGSRWRSTILAYCAYAAIFCPR